MLLNPVISLNNPDLTPIASNIFEAKRDRVDAAIPQVALAAASHRKQRTQVMIYILLSLLYRLTHNGRSTSVKRLHYKL